ncbi:MAG TPA: FAD-binding oxidoreductase [Rhizomicrobium sp.]|jgi:FAD/FMN-containing dehydrogenase|nr:FAD-binding oxidoreductase [Rhizomicrobium sp.]
MLRRDFLKTMAAVVALQGLSLTGLRAFASGFRRVRPGDAAWPGAASWQKLSNAVGGNLIKVRSLFVTCQADAKSAACIDVLKNVRNPFYLGDQPGGTQVSGWWNAWIPAPSAYAVRARNAKDVAAAVNFARKNKLRLVVKGTGHSYQGTSDAPDALLIWTRGMNQVVLHDAFVPQACAGKVAPEPAVTAQAGAVWIDLYTAVTTKAGRYVQGGGCTDVGVAGLIQSGGFGSFSKAFGTAASGLLEAEIVTADGQIRIANACTNPDLFWALKGGGGGSWGVVTKLTLRTHALPAHFGSAWGTIKAKSDDSFRKLIARFVAFYADSLFNPHWGEQALIHPNNSLEISMVCQGLDTAQMQAVWRPFHDWVAAQADLVVTEELGARAVPSAQHWWDVEGNPAMTPDTRPGAPKDHGWWKGDQGEVGIFLHGYESLWLPAALLQKGRQQQLTNALFAASRYKIVRLHVNKGLAGAPDEALASAKDTATNPAVTEAFTLVIIADGEAPAYPGMPGAKIDRAAAQKDARLIDLAAAEFFRIAPDAGSYVSESNYFNPRWQDAYWGGNYARLQAVKAKYDPEGLFFVHHGVGSEGWSADGFARF